jgi:hypothetical protein
MQKTQTKPEGIYPMCARARVCVCSYVCVYVCVCVCVRACVLQHLNV